MLARLDFGAPLRRPTTNLPPKKEEGKEEETNLEQKNGGLEEAAAEATKNLSSLSTPKTLRHFTAFAPDIFFKKAIRLSARIRSLEIYRQKDE